MNIKAVLIDFDGTLVTRDILTFVCEIVHKESESEKLNDEYLKGLKPGIGPLITRINFLKGVTLDQIYEKLSNNNYLMPGAQKLFKYLNTNNIITILNSGNLVPILEYYQKLLDITYVVGTRPKMNSSTITGITENDFSGPNFKLEDSKLLLNKHGISPKEVVSIGDSIADKINFKFAHKSIAINPRGDITKYSDYTIKNNLSKIITILDNLSNNSQLSNNN